MQTRQYWVVLHRRNSLLDGKVEHIQMSDCFPKFFHTRKEARSFIKEKFGYLKNRPDLRAKPHGIRAPIAIKATVTIEY